MVVEGFKRLWILIAALIVAGLALGGLVIYAKPFMPRSFAFTTAITISEVLWEYVSSQGQPLIYKVSIYYPLVPGEREVVVNVTGVEGVVRVIVRHQSGYEECLNPCTFSYTARYPFVIADIYVVVEALGAVKGEPSLKVRVESLE